jgi:hypothetical protein
LVDASIGLNLLHALFALRPFCLGRGEARRAWAGLAMSDPEQLRKQHKHTHKATATWNSAQQRTLQMFRTSGGNLVP